MSVRVDGVGNIIGRLEPRSLDATTDAFVIGSHLDTVPNAGKYDGILGVMAGIAVVEMLKDAELPFAIEVVGFSEEEGVRFGKPYIGSKGFIGRLDPAWMKLTDKNGVSVAEAIRAFGLEPAAAAVRNLRGYLELHIEQGPVLEQKEMALGVVTAIAGQTRMVVRLTGKAGHAGTVPMGMRRDALAGAAGVVIGVEAIGLNTEGLVATVGKLLVSPNGTNVVPGAVEFSLDVRHADDATRERAVEEILEMIQGIGEQRELAVEILSRGDFAAVQMDDALTTGLSESIHKLGVKPLELVSGAGHDAAVLAEVCPTAMLFVRNPGGISHHPEESVAEADVAEALRVMYAFVLRMARE